MKPKLLKMFCHDRALQQNPPLIFNVGKLDNLIKSFKRLYQKSCYSKMERVRNHKWMTEQVSKDLFFPELEHVSDDLSKDLFIPEL